MMTPESVCAEHGIDLVYFDGRDTDKKGIYNKRANMIAVDVYLDDVERKKVIYHEMGHEDHDPSQYNRRCEQYELQADRNMIHYLVKEELALMDDISEFNYVRFMEKYDLKTTVNETMVIEEFNNLVNN
ncbi:ImmA/IrrE family metallo-endopeptidase [Streptococcus suis]|uniref:ImmA/IrrE family metallo-endopeptidase n=1 Tax=Streptococcus suis TaxID=1307 RepID=UPI00209B9B4F|nr:ImmA/IrrE family metallo-endopeptidase [Streptococcus suis]MCO8241143.1 ImmA/IrrE family metallo-endopeptidase [Streptococcus suis]